MIFPHPTLLRFSPYLDLKTEYEYFVHEGTFLIETKIKYFVGKIRRLVMGSPLK